ncbi:adenosine receptor A2a-like, partial [Mustelus asterias]
LGHEDKAARGSIVTSLYIAVEVLIAVLAIAGNILVCWAVRTNPRLRSTTNYFLVSLAVADFAVGVLVIPASIVISVKLAMNVHGCLFLACLVLIFTQNSIFSLLAIAIDRYLAVKHPLRYPVLVTGRRTHLLIALLWVLSSMLGLIPVFGWNRSASARRVCPGSEGANETMPGPLSRANGSGRRCAQVYCLFEHVVDLSYMVYCNFLACVLAPLLAVLVIYARIFAVARRQLRSLGGCPRAVLRGELRAAKVLLLVVGLFALGWLPLHSLNALGALCPSCGRPPLWLMDTTIVLSHANSAVNPIIYALRLREFRLTFLGLARRDSWLASRARALNAGAGHPPGHT